MSIRLDLFGIEIKIDGFNVGIPHIIKSKVQITINGDLVSGEKMVKRIGEYGGGSVFDDS